MHLLEFYHHFKEINWDYYDYDEKIDLIRLRINSLKEGASKIQKLDILGEDKRY